MHTLGWLGMSIFGYVYLLTMEPGLGDIKTNVILEFDSLDASIRYWKTFLLCVNEIITLCIRQSVNWTI